MKLKTIPNPYTFYQEIRSLPNRQINLMIEAANDNPFYKDVTRSFYNEARKSHKKIPIIKRLKWGVALCELPQTFDEYFMMVEGSARRNYKKAKRLGYTFGPLDYNNRLEEVTAILHSTDTRQGKISDEFLAKKALPHDNPASLSPNHDYPYFGVFDKEGVLLAYASCFIAGEVCMIEHIYGHAAKQSDGYVPLLILSMAEHVMGIYPEVNYYGYGTWYGANRSMQRFKRKFHFLPHRIKWKL